LAAILSATGEKNPSLAWHLNTQSLLNVLEIAQDESIHKVFWPSSIAVFGQFAVKRGCPQHTVLQPSTMYGISKAAGEDLCNYYFKKFGVDVRSIRLPGLISHSCLPGGGTTDYAVDIFYQALSTGHYTCFLKRDTILPMLYMPDASDAIITLMETPADNISVRTSYNIGAISFSPEDIAAEIKKIIPSFEIDYEPDYRQGIAETWPQSLDDRYASSDLNWSPQFNLSSITSDMISKLSHRYKNVV
ncbi:MAG: NAD-dependent epimerase/dehydratase family protein, partial [Flavitalea sp.]